MIAGFKAGKGVMVCGRMAAVGGLLVCAFLASAPLCWAAPGAQRAETIVPGDPTLALAEPPVRAIQPALNWGLDAVDYDALSMTDIAAKAKIAERIAALRPAAAAGDPEAMLLVGYAYDLGAGVEKDESVSIVWLERAARAGLPRGMTAYAWALFAGEGAPANPSAAVLWFQRAEAAGNAHAMTNLGYLARNGLAGQPKDPAAARRHFERAVAKGNRLGMYYLAQMLLAGEGGPPDPPRGLALLNTLAEQGDVYSFAALAYAYREGRGVDVDLAKARAFSLRAAELGDAGEMFNFGLMASQGDGGPKDAALAGRWLVRAANAPDAPVALRVRARALLAELGGTDS
jgi:TPR repeat protein